MITFLSILMLIIMIMPTIIILWYILNFIFLFIKWVYAKFTKNSINREFVKKYK